MREDFLHFIWKYKKLRFNDELRTSNNEVLNIISEGIHNHLEGPDFNNAHLKIGDQSWFGTVEIHIKSSDWFAHGHETDVNYENVILHVVWEEDIAIYRKDNTQIPTLELKNYISPDLLESYKSLFNKKGKAFINCEKDIATINQFIYKNWIDRLYFERLESKSNFVLQLLKHSKNDWEQVLFIMLLKNFGLKINADSFLSIAQQLDFSVIRKTNGEVKQLESLLFGMSGLLEEEIVDTYYIDLKKEYDYLKHKFNLNSNGVLKPYFFKLRPPNFPTIRLSQFAKVYSENQNLFSKVIAAKSLEELYAIFNVSASVYWENHFTFGKESKKSTKKLTKNFIDLLIINTILPIKFNYAQHLGKEIDNDILKIVTEIKKENNTIVENFKALQINLSNAMESQAILQLYNDYCSKNKCLQCAVGNSLLKGNT